jgi:hypothetical protein
MTTNQGEIPAAAQAANPDQVPAMQGNAGVPPVFALNPADITGGNAFIDYASPEGRKIYYKSIEPLPTKYDGNQRGLQMFIHQVELKAKTFGWHPSLTNVVVGAATYSLFEQYGQISVDAIRAHAANAYIGQASKACQDSNAFKLFLDGSLGDDIMMRVLAQKAKYTINGIQDGPTMFRIILSIVGIETTALVAVINAKLRSLPATMAERKHDITAFNEFVTRQVQELTARGKEPQDLLFVLFEAYVTVTNPVFVEYIRAKKNDVFDGTITDMDYQDLMNIAGEKYKIMNTTGEWHTATDSTNTTEDHLLALTAAIKELQLTKKKVQGSTKSKAKDNKDNKSNDKWKWKEIAPKDNESHHKTVNGKDYVYCPHHNTTKWVLAEKHKDGCTVDDTWKFPPKNGPTSLAANPEVSKEQQLMKALYSIQDDEDDQDENV